MPYYYLEKHKWIIITKEKIEEYIIEADTLEKKAFIIILWLTGCRINECTQLTKDNFKINNGILNIYLMTLKRGDGQIRVNEFDIKTTPFLNYIFQYLKTSNNFLLFEKTDRSYQRYFGQIDLIVNGERTLTPHYLRHSRMSYFAHILDGSTWELKGWFNTKSINIYNSYVIPKVPERFKHNIN